MRFIPDLLGSGGEIERISEESNELQAELESSQELSSGLTAENEQLKEKVYCS